jgi:lipoprotein-anchoring transpeptidase ErfK/SrfK
MIGGAAIRPTLVGAQIVVTFVGANVAGGVAACTYQNQQVQAAKAAFDGASSAFDAQVKRSLDEGTPQAMVDPLVEQKRKITSRPLPAAAFIIDRTQLNAIQRRAQVVKALSSQVRGTEDQAASQLHEQLVQALLALNNDIKPASAAGVDTAEYHKFVDETTAANQAVGTPRSIQTAIDSINAREQALNAATAARIAANQALQAAQADARSAVSSAQAALAKAQAIPVLKLGDAATAIPALGDRLSHAGGLADFQDIASKAWFQSAALNAMLSMRQSAYDLLTATRNEIGLAQNAGKDVSHDSANIDAAAKQLDAANDLPTLTAAKAAIQTVKNDVDAKYWQAIYGQGKVIVISAQKQELIALENGAVKLDTVVATGRTSLPTPPGVYHIFYKSSPYHMHSPWPPGNQYWYPDVDMKYAMEFIEGGYFIHDAPWRSRWGPGANNEGTGTHGCVNVPRSSGQMDFLYGWADMGTTVVVLQGDFGSQP